MTLSLNSLLLLQGLLLDHPLSLHASDEEIEAVLQTRRELAAEIERVSGA